MSDADENAVMAELGSAAGAENGAATDNANPDAAVDTAAEGGAGESTVSNDGDSEDVQLTRQQKAAITRAKNKAEREEQEALLRKVEENAGIHKSPGELPRDDNGDPLYYYNPKTKRVIEANPTLNRPDIRNRMKLIPCQAPEGEREVDSTPSAAVVG